MITAYCDGACRKGNPGDCAAAFVVYKDGEFFVSQGFYLGPELHTNNFAEYMAFTLLLEFLWKNKLSDVTIYTDSLLVVEQVNQRWKVNKEDLRLMCAKAYALLISGGHKLFHVKGHDGVLGNEEVDRLCNEVLDAQEKNV